MRLIRSADKGIEQTEPPHSAARMVNDALMRGRHTIDGLNQIGSRARIASDSEIVEAVSKGDLLLVKPRTAGSGGGWMPRSSPVPEPIHIVQDHWPPPKPREDQVFAKSCIAENWCQTTAGTTIESASNFGRIMVAGAMLLPSSSTAIASALGADMALGRLAGGGILQQRLNWLIRGAGGPASVFVLGMLPAKMGDGTLHTDEQLRNMSHAPTRVRFQFRRDPDGVLQVYGIHSGAAGDDSVRTVQVTWNADKTAMEAKLNGITLLWTPQHGPLGSIPPLIYPGDMGRRRGTILVHPIPADVDSQIEGLPGEDITTDDCILVFPADTGLKSLYVVFSKPAPGDHKYYPPPKVLSAFPDARIAPRKTPIKGGGGLRKRWKTKDGTIFEWDSQHGAVERYNKRGKHLGEFDPETGEQTKDADDSREVEP
ncbi:S-type Pyocin [Pseudomonas mediterranea]|uniref:colicin E3/pyocin S6 family cytotoxin n=1 Tax=Pseudomonas mediterranea TaxID=183795 RepID=UPI0013176C0A|nr:colicin E3/pyocin S6 family cytotoxin [Pseudomonas mediterranea]QHA81026.1 S-type Pyocin [Pseudomonas mediterranea]